MDTSVPNTIINKKGACDHCHTDEHIVSHNVCSGDEEKYRLKILDKIRKDVYIRNDVIFDRIHPELITVEDYAEIGDRSIISAHSRGSLLLRDRFPRSAKPVKIGRGVWIAPGCIILQGVEIGEKTVVGTGAVVTKSLPSNCVAVGVPAKVIKTFE
jgi:acetyltransferase-like isoleucine patch superfamily enzyme